MRDIDDDPWDSLDMHRRVSSQSYSGVTAATYNLLLLLHLSCSFAKLLINIHSYIVNILRFIENFYFH